MSTQDKFEDYEPKEHRKLQEKKKRTGKVWEKRFPKSSRRLRELDEQLLAIKVKAAKAKVEEKAKAKADAQAKKAEKNKAALLEAKGLMPEKRKYQHLEEQNAEYKRVMRENPNPAPKSVVAIEISKLKLKIDKKIKAAEKKNGKVGRNQ